VFAFALPLFAVVGVAGAGDDVAADEFADLCRSSRTSFNSSTHAADVAAYHGRDQTAADLHLLDDFDVGGLGHRVGGFDQGDQALGFNETNCRTHVYLFLCEVGLD